MSVMTCEERAQEALGKTFGPLLPWEVALIQEYCRAGLPGLLAAEAIAYIRSQRKFIEAIARNLGRPLTDDELTEALDLFRKTDMSADEATTHLRQVFAVPKKDPSHNSTFRN